jgi:hypothetical protein
VSLNTAHIWTMIDGTETVTLQRRYTNGAYSNTSVTALRRPPRQPGGVGWVPGCEAVFLLEAADLTVDVLPSYNLKDSSSVSWVIMSVSNQALGATLRCECKRFET